MDKFEMSEKVFKCLMDAVPSEFRSVEYDECDGSIIVKADNKRFLIDIKEV